jgi:hypothetical protein
MQINLIPDSSVSSAPAGFTAAVQAAADIYDQDFPGNYTVNITYGWGTFDNQPDPVLNNPSSGVFSEGGVIGYTDVSYATVKSWLTAYASLSDQQTAYASLPASSAAFPGGANSFFVSSAQEKALGQFTGSATAIDGSIGFNTVDSSIFYLPYLETAALVEIGHALGWYTEYYTQSRDPTILDLFRYASPGNYEWTGGQPAYFSTDGGATDLANYSTTFDYTLFTNVPQNDPFNIAEIAGHGAPAQALTSLDIEILNDIGFGGTALPVISAPVISAPAAATVSQGQATAISGISLSESGNTAGETFTVTLADTNGALSATATGGGDVVSGSGTTSLAISGSLAQVNSDLGTLTDTDGTALSDTITLNASDSLGNTASPQAIAVTVTAGQVPEAFAIDDLTTGVQSLLQGTPYTGPVAGLVDQYIYTGSDNLNVTALVANTFIHTGAGEDAIDVSNVGGTNVLDGGTNSNFLVGGTGPASFDIFFVDDRGPSADIWSTVANFHAGDAATVFGITQNSFTTAWVDGQGAAGYTGLTLHVTAPGVPTASLTLSGYTTADLTNGTLTTTYGTENDGTPYLYIHASS